MKNTKISAELKKQKNIVAVEREMVVAKDKKVPAVETLRGVDKLQLSTQPTGPAKNATGKGTGGATNQSIASQSSVSPKSNAGIAQSGSAIGKDSQVYGGAAKAAFVCQRPTVDTVNGRVKGAWFTPDPQYNHYTIQGCGFGDPQGKAYLLVPFAMPTVNLSVEYWSDTSIIAAMDPSLMGELDHLGNVTLVVAPANAKQVQTTGHNFYAARQEVQLTTFPQSQ